MIWLLFLALAVLALAPLGLVLLRPPRPHGRQEADLAFYRAQLTELERERAAGRLDEPAFNAARTEVQRRLLAAPADRAPAQASRGSALLAAGLFLIPAGGFALYLWHGAPDVPAAPYVERAAVAARDDALLAQLRNRIAMVPPQSEGARQGWLLLGNAERGRGRLDEAAEALSHALAIRFDAGLAADLAELQIQRGDTAAAARILATALRQSPGDPRLRFLSGLLEAREGRSQNARATWQALLADTPADAPWRALLERELQGLP
ncbi:c-type cytochrome biogenesis protein CcmI [Roseomonas marmotae]|uniref:C-type cytochrome biogenesis protein CcmI n=1 Tax=Roseomonas marmotae TaxID=2768161 RepID=A0ABS3KGT6_9PROT|nr:c-type cytochrome biogenesis protein CcmI [Roseomonas marmotae]MBO1076687.1 c-type cytochrome biogenesis protein CcmI [Roseomonas marmotae]QTI79851.1 c-type cytochrome biogenesis protein CcmI [Roseomonas marmotae]